MNAPAQAALRLAIEPIIDKAEQMAAVVRRDLPGHEGLAHAAGVVASAARAAERVSRQLRRPFGLHRLPAAFLALAVLLVAGWLYQQFFHVPQVSIALPDRDARQLHERVRVDRRVQFRGVPVPGSREAAALVGGGEVDLAFVQGGIPLPEGCRWIETPNPELVLYFVRTGAPRGAPRYVLTSLALEGSHSVALDFMKAWQAAPRFVHDWKPLSADPRYRIPPDVDAVFVVKDPSDEKTWAATERLASDGFQLAAPDLGARALSLPYLRRTEIPPGYLRVDPPIPPSPVPTYSVASYLVARPGLTPRLLGVARHIFEPHPDTISEQAVELNMAQTGEILQGVEAFLTILMEIGLAFLALLGIEIMSYRRRFNELNSLISLISMHQSNKDVLGVGDPVERSSNLLYLSLCSDLLGLISAITGYYAQENASLLYNNLLEIIHQRCDSLKINIQLKVLHAAIDLAPLPTTAAPASAAAGGGPA